MIIEYYIQNNYGAIHYYIKNPQIARFHEALTRRKTITSKDMRNYTNFSRGYITFTQTTK